MACDRGLHVDAEVRRRLLETVLHAADEVVEEGEDHRLVARRVERAAVVPVREVRPDLPRLAEHAERVVDARRELLVLPLVEEVGRDVDAAEAGIRRAPDPLVRAVVVEGVLEDQRRDEVLRLFVREFVLGEVRGYIPVLSSKTELDPSVLDFLLTLLPLSPYPASVYRRSIPKAKVLIGRRDPGDVDTLALALHLDLPLWTNDRDFEHTGVSLDTTRQLLAQLFPKRV